jgi:hypothetical protein
VKFHSIDDRDAPRSSFGQRAPSIGSMTASASLKHSSSAVAVASDAVASFGAKASLRRPRCARSKTKEETMQILTPYELKRLTRIELLALLRKIADILPELREGSRERQIALTNLQRIRYILWRPYLAP